MRILGIDPGLNHTGWGIIEQQRGGMLRYIASGTVSTKPKDPLDMRLLALHQEIERVSDAYKPEEAAIEETFVNVNASSTLKLGNARGALILSLAVAGMPVQEYAATLVKKSIVGAGRAEKGQVGMMVKTLLPACDEQGADALDALAIAICHANHRHMHQLTKAG
jgi:crossover junction endodeoxyribonuclease RuvC